MNEESIVKKQLYTNIVVISLTIVIIFIIFGMFIYYNFSKSIFTSSDKELKEAYVQMERFREAEKSSDSVEQSEIQKIEVIDHLYKLMLKQTSPRIMYILRNSDGTIVSDLSQGGYVSELFSDIVFDNTYLNKIYSVLLDGQYNYRTIIFRWDDNLYGQALINVDSEIEIIQKFKTDLVSAIVISIGVITLASLFLSERTMKPVTKALYKQKMFVQNASHELRTPLAIIQAKQETLLEKPNSKIIDNAQDISITLKEVRRLKKLISQLMQETTNDEIQKLTDVRTFDLDKEILEYETLYTDLAQKQKKNLNFDLKYANQISANEDKIRELLVILLDNAFKYTNKNDSIQVKTYKKDGKCVLEVIDTGIGISKEATKHIFERFYREEKSRQRDSGGMGLGLSIAYEIVKLHKGQIRVESNQNSGTRFIIKLPMRQSENNIKRM